MPSNGCGINGFCLVSILFCQVNPIYLIRNIFVLVYYAHGTRTEKGGL